MRLCKNCKYSVVEFLGHTRCKFRTEPVNGGPKDYADYARKVDGHCGESAKNFVQKKTILMKVVNYFK